MKLPPEHRRRLQRHERLAAALIISGLIGEYVAASWPSDWSVGGNALDILGSLLFIAWLASPIFAVGFLVWKRAIGTFFALVCWAACLALAVHAAAAVHAGTSSLSGLVFVVEPVYAFIGLGVMLVLRAGLRAGPRPGL